MENKDLLKGMENASAYREMFLTRKMTGARRQTYIDESLYETLTGILPVIAPGISVPTFVNNVLAEHMEKYRDIIDETWHRKFKEMMVWKDSSICRLGSAVPLTCYIRYGNKRKKYVSCVTCCTRRRKENK